MIKNALEVVSPEYGGYAYEGLSVGINAATAWNVGTQLAAGQSTLPWQPVAEETPGIWAADKAKGAQLQQKLDQMVEESDYVYRYTTREMAGIYEQRGYISTRGDGPTYMTTQYSTSAREVVEGAQIMPEWPQPEVRIKIPVPELETPVVPRPRGNTTPVGWELYTDSYPGAGLGGWDQFLAKTKSFDPSWVEMLQE